LISLITRHWFALITSDKASSIQLFARNHKLSENDVSRFLLLPFLAPEFIEAVLAGRQPFELTADKLKGYCPCRNPASLHQTRSLILAKTAQNTVFSGAIHKSA